MDQYFYIESVQLQQQGKPTMKNKIKMILVTLVALGCISNAQAAIYYVKSGPSNGNGSSWSKAFNHLDSALKAASSGSNQIWVAGGTYKPSIIYPGGYSGIQSNLVTFLLPNNVACG